MYAIRGRLRIPLHSQFPKPTKLDSLLSVLHAQIAGRSQEAQEGPTPESRPPIPTPALQAVTVRQAEAPAPRIVVRFKALAEIVQLDQLRSGPRRLLELLHRLALDVAKARRYHPTVSQVVMHQSQELLAEALGVHRVTVWRWLKDLETLGVIEAREHFTTTTEKGNRVTRVDGTLYAVALRAGHRATLRRDDLKHQHRDLDAAKRTKNTAHQVLQQSKTLEQVEWYSILRNWAVNPDSDHSHPLNTDCCIPEFARLDEIAYTLPLLAEAHPTKRAALVGMLASRIAHALADQHSRRYWCRVIWDAWNEEIEGRAGLQALAAQLHRLDADRREWQGLKNPAALFVSRAKGSH